MRLRRSDCSRPGWTRKGAGKGFAYFDERGRRIRAPEDIARIRALVLPPAWTDVWICPWPNGHLQAVGTDAAGRRQYRYHDVWRQQRDREKFDHMLDFAAALPGLRERCRAAMADDPLDRDGVLACATRLLDLGFFRIGTEGYAEQNQSFGLATIRKDHVTVGRDGTLAFDYVAKSGKRRVQSIVDADVHGVIATLKRRRGGGPDLLAWRDGSRWVDVRSQDINAWIKEQTGGDFTAKDFRTWSATVLAAVALAVAAGASSATAQRAAVRRAYTEVAHYLGNTPAVARSSYIDPRIIDHYLADKTVHHALRELGASPDAVAIHGPVEAAVLRLLRQEPARVAAA